MEGIQTVEIGPRYCPHLAPFQEGKFGAVWALDGSNSISQTRHVSNSTTNSLSLIESRSLRIPQMTWCFLSPSSLLSAKSYHKARLADTSYLLPRECLDFVLHCIVIMPVQCVHAVADNATSLSYVHNENEFKYRCLQTNAKWGHILMEVLFFQETILFFRNSRSRFLIELQRLGNWCK